MIKRAIIIDDERLARNELKKLLMDYPEVEVVAEAANASEGIEKVESHKMRFLMAKCKRFSRTIID